MFLFAGRFTALLGAGCEWFVRLKKGIERDCIVQGRAYGEWFGQDAAHSSFSWFQSRSAAG